MGKIPKHLLNINEDEINNCNKRGACPNTRFHEIPYLKY